MKHLSIFILSLLCCINALQAQVELSYCGDIDQGFGDAGVIYTPYVQFEATTMTPYAGNYIKQVLVGMKADATNVTIYIKNAPRDTNPLYRQTVSEGLTEGWNVITLDTPFEIPEGKEIAIGCRFRSTEKKCFRLQYRKELSRRPDPYQPKFQVDYLWRFAMHQGIGRR